ncbi:hypothetical protein FCM35_KLT10092 [Carex littledalei]|uniref:KIB1-4 beta-propeller domain-containing protein n=1 Tax=Carex littledalei TaxID=544730 RepID=A0A833VYV1_9POAL|nr:hypothetical protein FCM35_KLT10092 [Carex littledalei]
MGEDIATRKRIFFDLSESKHYYMDLPELHNQFVCGSSFGWLFTLDIALNIRMLNPFTRESYDLPRLYFRHQGKLIKCRQHGLVYKVILDGDPNERSDFTVMLIGCYHKKIAFWKQGDSTWTLPLFPYSYHYTRVNDIIFSKGKFYGVVRHQFADQFFFVDVGPDSKLIYTASTSKENSDDSRILQVPSGVQRRIVAHTMGQREGGALL